MTRKLIGIVGHMGAGKTTTCKAATKLHGGDFYHMGFSDPFKRMLAAVGIEEAFYNDKSRWNDPLPELCGKTLRHATRTLGQTWGRECIGDEFWTIIALQTARQRMAEWNHVIIDNVRYLSEFEMIEKAGGKFIAFHRPGLEPDMSHVSETSIPELQTYCHHRFYHREPFEASNRLFARLLAEITG